MSLAIQNLEMLRRVAKLHKRNNAEWYFGELTDYSVVLRDAEIERRANRIWAVHDGPALQAEFDKRLSPKACPEFIEGSKGLQHRLLVRHQRPFGTPCGRRAGRGRERGR